MARIGTLLLALVISTWADLGSANAAKRVALVVGNGAYEYVTALPNPKNDAKEIAAKLTALEFDVRLLSDASYNDLREALAELSNAAIGAEIGAVFFAGHGIEVDRQNYLIPVDAKLETDVRVRFEAMPLDDVMAALEGVTGVRLVMLDACRNNPFVSSMKVKTANRSISRGLSKVEPSVGSLVSFSAKEGTTAADGTGEHSPYTAALLANLDKPGIEINRLFRIVRDEVLTSTDGEQEPYTYGSTSSSEIFLREPLKEPPQSVPPAAPAIAPADLILVDFQLAKEYGTIEAWQAFLEKHGQVKSNFYVDLARVALRKLKSPEKNFANETPTGPETAKQDGLTPEQQAITQPKAKALQSKQKNATKTAKPETKTTKATATPQLSTSAGSLKDKPVGKKKARPSANIVAKTGNTRRNALGEIKTEYGTIVCDDRKIACRWKD